VARFDLVFYVTGHGLGHAARAGAVAAELRSRDRRLRLAARSAGPAPLLAEADPGTTLLPSPAAELDPGAVQRNALEVDAAATAEAHAAFLRTFEDRVAQEAAWLREVRARVVVADVAPLGAAAAARAGLPALVVGNFGWDALLAHWVPAHPALRPAVARYREAYAEALAVRLPLHEGLEAFPRRVEAGHAVRALARPRAELRRALGVSDASQPLLLVSLAAADLAALGPRDVDAGDAVVAGFGPAPPGTRSRWVDLATGAPGTHPELVAAADAVLAKPGYGTVAEALVYRTRFLALPRPGWPETGPLRAGLERDGCALDLSREAFTAGAWRAPLETLLETLRPLRAPDADGASRAADLAFGLL